MLNSWQTLQFSGCARSETGPGCQVGAWLLLSSSLPLGPNARRGSRLISVVRWAFVFQLPLGILALMIEGL